MDELTAERQARNEATFRDANERIAAAAREIGVDTPTVPFVCECPDPACTDVLLVELADYVAVRRNDRRFVHAPGHDTETGTVVEVHPTFVVVEKTGAAGEAAERLAEP